MTTDNQTSFAQEVKDVVRKELATMDNLPPIDDLDDDEALEAVLDSISMLELVAVLEDRYSVRVAEHDMGWENFSSINNIAEFLTRKTAATNPR